MIRGRPARGRSSRGALPSGLALAALALTVGCAAPAADPTRGEARYRRYCMQCHDAEGGIGSRLTARGLAAYGTAQGLYNYNRRFMPYGAEATLPDRDYWDITAYLLVRHGFRGEDLPLRPHAAAQVALTPAAAR